MVFKFEIERSEVQSRKIVIITLKEHPF